MLTLFDYLPSQNAYKVRLLLNQLATRNERTNSAGCNDDHGRRGVERKLALLEREQAT